MKPNVYREQPHQGNNRIILCYSIIAIPSIRRWRICLTSHVGLRFALRQPTSRTTPQPASKPQAITKPALAPLLLSLIPLMTVAALNVPP